MKSLRATLIVPLLLLPAAALAHEAGAGTARDVPDFHGVQVGSGLKAHVTVGPKSVRISGDEEQVKWVRTEVVGGKLVVGLAKRSWFTTPSFRGLQVTISSPQVTSVEASGGAELDAEASATDTFWAEASGGAELSVRNLEVKKLKVEVSGGAEVTVKGRAEAAQVEASGGAELHARELSLKSLSVEASGGGSVAANPTEHLVVAASGGSSVHVDSAPTQRTLSTSGGSKVVFSKQ